MGHVKVRVIHAIRVRSWQWYDVSVHKCCLPLSYKSEGPFFPKMKGKKYKKNLIKFRALCVCVCVCVCLSVCSVYLFQLLNQATDSYLVFLATSDTRLRTHELLKVEEYQYHLRQNPEITHANRSLKKFCNIIFLQFNITIWRFCELFAFWLSDQNSCIIFDGL